MRDIVERLSQFDGDGYTRFRGLTISEEAAAEITQLRAELAKQQELMSEIVQEYDGDDNGRTLRWAVDEVRQYLATRRNK